MQDNKKAGQLAVEAMLKDPETTDAVEMQREMTKEYCDEVMKAAVEGAKRYDNIFYVVVLAKKERLMQNVVRSYFLARQTCPTPAYDQTVFQFNKLTGEVQELWVIPDEHTCNVFYTYPLEVPEEERCLLAYILDFYNGTLLEKAKKLNGEEKLINDIVLTVVPEKEELLCPKN